ncbi:hypothetical protein SAZ11_47980 [Streptomyces sp. FXJ1.4098]|nr:hypothetical protein [Streptomyces sp. FXJ1.4098]
MAVVHEAHTMGGVGGEIVAAVAEAGVALQAPPIRIGAPAARIPPRRCSPKPSFLQRIASHARWYRP